MTIKSITPYILSGMLFLFALNLGGCAFLGRPQPTSYQEPGTGMEFVFVKGGEFTMGDPLKRQSEALPLHNVTLNGFHVGKYEVTFDQYDKFCDATGRKRPADEQGWGRGNRPAINVSWDDANAFAQWLSQQSGLQISLPSEAQWEYFARAGTKGDFWMGGRIGKKANCADCGSQWSGRQTAPVGSFSPNAFGIYDTVGNVMEWTLDNFHPSYTSAPTDGTAWTHGGTEEKILRGTGWDTDGEDAGAAIRNWSDKSERSLAIGFRLVLAADPVTGAPQPLAKGK